MGLAYPQRFWRQVAAGEWNRCWLWTGKVMRQGYGRLFYRGSVGYAHRLAWELMRGPIPSGMCVLHTCDNPRCVNPNHLWLGTQIENMRDKRVKGRARNQYMAAR